jgi:hypothetical protein
MAAASAKQVGTVAAHTMKTVTATVRSSVAAAPSSMAGMAGDREGGGRRQGATGVGVRGTEDWSWQQTDARDDMDPSAVFRILAKSFLASPSSSSALLPPPPCLASERPVTYAQHLTPHWLQRDETSRHRHRHRRLPRVWAVRA